MGMYYQWWMDRNLIGRQPFPLSVQCSVILSLRTVEPYLGCRCVLDVLATGSLCAKFMCVLPSVSWWPLGFSTVGGCPLIFGYVDFMSIVQYERRSKQSCQDQSHHGEPRCWSQDAGCELSTSGPTIQAGRSLKSSQDKLVKSETTLVHREKAQSSHRCHWCSKGPHKQWGWQRPHRRPHLSNNRTGHRVTSITKCKYKFGDVLNKHYLASLSKDQRQTS